MFEFSISKDMKKGHNKGGDSREGSNTFMCSINCQEIKN